MTSYPILDAEAIKYGIDISQDDNIIKEQIEIKLKEYKKNNGSYKLIFVGKPKDSYTYLNSLAMFALEAAAKIRIYEITIDISKIYFYDRKIKPKMFEGLNGAYCTLYFTFPENEIKVIEDYAFIRMYSFLREIKIPDSVISIGESVFQQDEALNKVTFGKNLEYIGVSAFSYSGITEAVIPDSVTTIGEGHLQMILV